MTWLRLTQNAIPDSCLDATGGIDTSPGAVAFTGNASLRQFYLEDLDASKPGDTTSNDTLTFSATTPQSAIADALVNTAAIWVDALGFVKSIGFGVSPADEQSAVHTISDAYYQPYSTGKCVIDSIMSENDTRPISFPTVTAIQYNPAPHDLDNSLHYLHGVPVLDNPFV